jgi:hypothetical protein
MAVRKNTINLYKKIQDRYKQIYKVQRLRHDDVEAQLCEEFCKERQVIYRAIRADIEELEKQVSP